jgi:hypothetical protein
MGRTVRRGTTELRVLEGSGRGATASRDAAPRRTAAPAPAPAPTPTPTPGGAAREHPVGTPRRVDEPRPARVRADASGRPLTVDGRVIDAVRESWLVEDRWWTDQPLRRRYWEVVTVDGRDLVVFRELPAGDWFGQRG